MNAIQSFWITESSNKNGGWINKRFECFGWSLSYFLLRRRFEKLHLYCNSAGYTMLVEILGLQYDEIFKDLDGKDDLIRKSWGLGKMQTQASQKAPFVHVDGDVFWFDIPDDDFFEADIFTQSLEMDEPMYKNIWLNFQKYGAYFPEFLKSSNKSALAVNTGIVGGKRMELFSQVFDEALDFLKQNQAIIEHHSEDFKFISLYIEQSFLVGLMNELKVKIRFLKKPVFRSNFDEVLNFSQISADSKTPGYIHLLGSTRYKLLYGNLTEFWLHRFWPEQVKKINDLYLESEKKNTGFTNFLNPEQEKQLPVIKWIFDKPSDVLNHPFVRTESIFGININENQEGEMIHHPDSQRLSDCIAFEKERVQVLTELLNNTSPESMYAHFEEHKNFCAKSYQEISTMKFQLNKSKRLKSSYNWFNELRYETTNYWYNLIIDSQKICFQEFLMKETECQILEIFQDAMTIEDLALAWSTGYQKENNPKTKKMIHETLKEFFLNDLIRIY